MCIFLNCLRDIMEILPVPDTPALRIDIDGERTIVVGDLHLGISAEMAEKGIEIPNRVPEVQNRLLDLIRNQEADRLFLLGDVKHNIPVTSWEEWEYLPDFFADLSKEVKVEIVPGNHDGDIEGLLHRDVTLYEAEGTILGKGKIGLLHGHAWPRKELVRTDVLVMGHNHPTIEFKDDLGGKAKEPAWIKTRLKSENLPENLRKEIKGEGPEVMIVPAFSKLVGGGAFNREIPEGLLGPLFKSGAVDLDRAEVHLLDGTFLGRLENLKD